MDLLSNDLEDSPEWTPLEFAKGFRKRRIDQVPDWCPDSCEIRVGEAYNQQIHIAGEIFKLEKYRTESSFVLPASFADINTLPGSPDLPSSFESALMRHAESESESLLLFFQNACNNQLRRAVGLPGPPNSSNQNAYLNTTESFTHLHKKNMNLQSTNILWYGHPVVWMVVPQRHAGKLEAQVARVLQVSPTCSQFVGHTTIIIPPSLLTQWGINFTIFEQFSGEVVQTDYGAYCAKWSVGVNLGEETCSSDDPSWQPPPLYRHCCNKCAICPHPTSPGHEIARSTVNSDSATLAASDQDFWEYGDFSMLTNERQSIDGERNQTSDITVFLDSSVEFAPAPEDLGPNNDVEVEYFGAVRNEVESTQDHIDPSLLAIDFEDNFPNGVLPPGIFSSPSREPNNASPHDLGFEIISGVDVQGTSGRPSAEAEHVFELTVTGESTPTNTLSTAFSRSPDRRSDTTQVTSHDGASQPETLPYRSGGSKSLQLATQASPDSSTAGQLQFPSSNFAQEIEHLILSGLTREQDMLWKSNKTIDAKKTLGTFRLSKPLDANAIMETLLILASGRDGARVVDGASFRGALAQVEAARESQVGNLGMLLLLPIREVNHYYLVTLDARSRLVTIHDNATHEDIEEQILSETGNSWECSYKQVLGHDEIGCGVNLLFEAEKLLKNGVEHPGSFDALRARYIRVLLDGLLPAESHLSHPAVNAESYKHTSKRQTYLNDLASTIGCAEVIRDLIEMVGTLHQTQTTTSSKLGTAMATFLLGEATTRLGALQKDISSLFIAAKARKLLPHFQYLKEQKRKEKKTQKKRKREVQNVSLDTVIDLSAEISVVSTVVSSNRCMTDVYDQLVKELMRPDVDADLLRQRVRLASYHGRDLLPYQDICGSDHPLWVLLPAKTLKCPGNQELDVEPSMYRDLKEEEVRILAGLVQSSRPELWRRLPQLQQFVEDLVRNMKPDLRTLHELYEQVKERSAPTTVDLTG